MTHMLFADFSDRPSAERALDQLEEVGYRHDELRFITRGSEPSELADLHSAIPARRLLGSVVRGIVIGSGVGLAAAVIVSQVSLPLVSTTLFNGTLSGFGGIGALLLPGAVLGALAGAFFALVGRIAAPKDDISHFNEILAQGGAVIGVPVIPADEDTVREILSDCQHGLLDTGWGGQTSESYFSATGMSVARRNSSDQTESDSRIHASKLP